MSGKSLESANQAATANAAAPRRRGFDATTTWIFDLDNTLYPAECNLFAQVDQRMGEFIAKYLGVPFEYARHLQKSYYRQYGTTLCGLMQVHKLDPKAFLDKMGSFATNAKVNRGKQFMMRSGVQSTPTLVVNGKYRVQGKSFADMLRIADHLVAMERASMAASPTPSAAVDDAPASDAGYD